MTAPLPIPLRDAAAPRLARGVVVLADGVIAVRCGDERHVAQRATSCLVAPLPGDEVLLAVDGDDRFVLAVLSRPSDERLHLALDRDVDLSSAGTLRLVAGEGIDLVTRGRARVTAEAVEVVARVAEAAVDRVTAVGASLETQFGRFRALAESFDLVADRVVERVKRRYQIIEETDHLRAAHVDIRAEKTVALRGDHAVVAGRELVKVDADQVHVG